MMQTTLMDMVATVKTLPFQGKVSVNGSPILCHSGPEKVNGLDPKILAMRRVVGYVEQTDVANGAVLVG